MPEGFSKVQNRETGDIDIFDPGTKRIYKLAGEDSAGNPVYKSGRWYYTFENGKQTIPVKDVSLFDAARDQIVEKFGSSHSSNKSLEAALDKADASPFATAFARSRAKYFDELGAAGTREVLRKIDGKTDLLVQKNLPDLIGNAKAKWAVLAPIIKNEPLLTRLYELKPEVFDKLAAESAKELEIAVGRAKQEAAENIAAREASRPFAPEISPSEVAASE